MMGAMSCKGWLTDHWKSWPWIFFIEGAITVGFGRLALFFMLHATSQASFLIRWQEIETAIADVQLQAIGWLSNNLVPHYVGATGIGAQIAIANYAAFVAVFRYLSKDALVPQST
jgi:hypothetical protein